MSIQTIQILGTNISSVTMDEAVSYIWDVFERKEKLMVVTPNSEFIYLGYQDATFRDILNRAGLALPDGIGVVYASKILGTPLRERVAGYDACCRILKESAEHGATIYILGGKPGVAEIAKQKAEETYPGVRIVGVHDGYFKNDEEVLPEIEALQPDFLLVCTGCPKQEEFMVRNFERLPVKVMIGAGGSVDVLAGNVKRAPVFFCKFGLEWFYRLITQPWRIGRMMNLPKFLFTVIWKKWKGEGRYA